MDFKLNIQTPEPVFRQIEKFLSNQILERKDNSPFRLPSTSELASKWGVSCATIDKAMKNLAADGLIERRCKRGTFLKNNNDKAIIGILVGHKLTDETSHFSRALVRGIQAEIAGAHAGRRTCYVYDGLSGLKTDDDFGKSENYQRLKRDFRKQSFLGFIQILQETDHEVTRRVWDLPVCRFMHPAEERQTDVVLDFYTFTRECVKYVTRKGLKRIAYLRAITSHSTDLDGLYDAVKDFGLPSAQVYHTGDRAANGAYIEQRAYEKILQLSSEWQQSNNWPDALLVSDDISARGAALALLQRHIKPPANLLVMAMTNREITHHYGLPVVRYEICISAIASALVDILTKRIRNKNFLISPVMIHGKIVA
jgi:DNA-binding LacI/PurR family transcriptional regulator